MVYGGNSLTLDRVFIDGGRGVNFGGGGDDLRVFDCLSTNGGTGNWGGKWDGFAFFRTGGIDGNNKVKSTDGGTWGKFSRSNGGVFVDCYATGGKNAGWWGDINNSNWLFIRCKVNGVDYVNTGKPWTAVGFKHEISGNRDEGRAALTKVCREFNLITAQPSRDTVTLQELQDWNYIYKGCVATGNKSYGFDSNETRYVLYDGCSGTRNPDNTRDGGHLSVRDLRRDDAGAKGRADDWVSDTVRIVDFKALDGKEFWFWGGGAGTKIDFARHHITIVNPLAGDGTPARLVKKNTAN